MEKGSNGVYNFNQRFDQVDKELVELKDDLAAAIRRLAESIEKQATATTLLEKTVGTLATQFSSFLTIAANAIPLKAVLWMFVILVVSILLILGGVEGLKLLPKFMGMI